MRRVVITGVGALTPAGNVFLDAWKALLTKKNVLTKIPAHLNVDKVKYGGFISGFSPLGILSRKELNRLDPFVQYGVISSAMAVCDANLFLQEEETAIFIGSSRGGISKIDSTYLEQKNNRIVPSPYLMPATTISMAASFIAHKLSISGPVLGISNACASGTAAIGQGYLAVKHGQVNTAIVGGTDAPLTTICLKGYDSSHVLSRKDRPTLSCPFDIDRSGFVLSEGAATVILEELGQALERRAKIYCEITGYSNHTGGFNQVRPDKESEVVAIKKALASANCKNGDVDFINTHGASTIMGDEVEAQAIKEVFGEKVLSLPVTANKSVTGHMLGASGAFETAVTAMSLKKGILPPTSNIKNLDPKCSPLNMPKDPLHGDFKVGITNSFGFGGINCVLVLKKLSS